MRRTRSHDFRPSPGTVTALRVPGGIGTRFDTLLYPGYQVSPFYDSLLGKLIVWDEIARDGAAPARPRARRIERRGRHHDGAACISVSSEAPEIRAGAFHTRWLEQWLAHEHQAAATS